MARPKKIIIKLSMGKDILFNKDYFTDEQLATMSDSNYKRVMASKQHALKEGKANINNKLKTLSLKDFDTIKEYNIEYSNLKHYLNVVEDYIQELKSDYRLYFKETSTVDDFLKAKY